DAWMPFHPAIEEPSNAWPSSNLSLLKCLAGTLTCCSLPRVSVNRRSTNLTSLSLMSFKTSSGVIAMGNLLSVSLCCKSADRRSRFHASRGGALLVRGFRGFRVGTKGDGNSTERPCTRQGRFSPPCTTPGRRRCARGASIPGSYNGRDERHRRHPPGCPGAGEADGPLLRGRPPSRGGLRPHAGGRKARGCPHQARDALRR